MIKTNLKGYRFILHKSYFDKGYSWSYYVKYFIAFFGVSSRSVKWTLIIGVLYAFFCYFFGMYLFKSKLVLAEAEVGNQYNLFVEEMRNKISGADIISTPKTI